MQMPATRQPGTGSKDINGVAAAVVAWSIQGSKTLHNTTFVGVQQIRRVSLCVSVYYLSLFPDRAAPLQMRPRAANTPTINTQYHSDLHSRYHPQKSSGPVQTHTCRRLQAAVYLVLAALPSGHQSHVGYHADAPSQPAS